MSWLIFALVNNWGLRLAVSQLLAAALFGVVAVFPNADHSATINWSMSPLATRIALCGCLLLIADHAFIGALWPTPYTITAVLSLPASFVCIFGLIAPRVLHRFVFLRAYVIGAAIGSSLALLAFCLPLPGRYF